MAKDNPERNRSRAAEWYANNKERGRATRRAYYKRNKARINAANKRSRARNKEKHREQQRWYRLKDKYGITRLEYERMFAKQGGVCIICRKEPEPGTFLDVDHCHASSAIRGLLCRHCNQGLGHFHDSPELLERASLYLKGTKVYV